MKKIVGILAIMILFASAVSCGNNREKESKEYKKYETAEFFKLCGEYTSYSMSGGGISGQYKVSIKLNSNKTFSLKFYDTFTGSLIERIKGTYTYIPEVGGVLYSDGEQVGTYEIEDYYDILPNDVSVISVGEYELYRN